MKVFIVNIGWRFLGLIGNMVLTLLTLISVFVFVVSDNIHLLTCMRKLRVSNREAIASYPHRCK